jgi:hypothetical protein
MNMKKNTLLLALYLVLGTALVSLPKPPKAAPDPLGNTSRKSLSSKNDGAIVAPVPDGMYIFLLLAGGYGVFKYFQARKV